MNADVDTSETMDNGSVIDDKNKASRSLMMLFDSPTEDGENKKDIGSDTIEESPSKVNELQTLFTPPRKANPQLNTNELSSLFVPLKKEEPASNVKEIKDLFTPPLPQSQSRVLMRQDTQKASNKHGLQKEHMFISYDSIDYKEEELDSPMRLPTDRDSPQKSSSDKTSHSYHFPSFLNENLKENLIGSVVCALYHIVFSLALSSGITRKYSPDQSILKPITCMAALTGFIPGPLLVFVLGDENAKFDHGYLPSLYPGLDLFLAPFLAHMASIIDETLYLERIQSGNSEDHDDTAVFLTTYGVMIAISMLILSLLNILSTKIKLANLGVFLPHAVLGGFFSSVGLNIWLLSFQVDNNGKKFQSMFVLQDGETSMMRNWIEGLTHHLPSLCLGFAMFMRPELNALLMVGSVVSGYVVMFLTRTSLQQAQENGWFFGSEAFDLSYKYDDLWLPPAPFGVVAAPFLSSSTRPLIHWKAISNGWHSIVAMALIYALRCSLHATAVKRNNNNIVQIIQDGSTAKDMRETTKTKEEKSDEDVEFLFGEFENDEEDDETNKKQSKQKTPDVQCLLNWYGIVQFISTFSGCVGCIPTIAISSTLTKLGAYQAYPQYGSFLILFYFYMTGFTQLQYIPKITFSSLLVLCFCDLMNTWFFKSYKLTKQKDEWLFVAPLIVLSSYVIGMLMSVALGVAISTFIFVASFYRTGVVKYLDTGASLRSTIERNIADAEWLDNNGDLVQIMVLQNYLFFGNASSCLTYISSMFDDDLIDDDKIENSLSSYLPPVPKFLVIDFSFCTGMDASAVGVFADAVRLCNSNDCCVILSGMTNELREVMRYGKISASSSKTKKNLLFCRNLEMAIGIAEDGLLKHVHSKEMKESLQRTSFMEPNKCNDNVFNEVEAEADVDGFVETLNQLDIQHGTCFMPTLSELGKYTTPVVMRKNECLFEDRHGGHGVISESERGLFFIECGYLKVERDSANTLTRFANSIGQLRPLRNTASMLSLSKLNAKAMSAPSLGATPKEAETHTFRLARIGPGFVIGGIEFGFNLRNPGKYKAESSFCKLHHLPYYVIEQIEESEPRLVLNLYKMVSHVMARRHDITVQQLATIHSIIKNPALKKPVSRKAMAILKRTTLMMQ